MIHLPEQQILPLFRPFALGDVTRNFGRADDIAAEVSDWRNGQRNVDEASILALSDSLVMVDPLTATDAFEDSRFFVVAIDRNEQSHRLADRFLAGIPEETLRAIVPARNDAVDVFRKDGVVGRFDNRGVVLRGFFVSFALGDVNQHVDCAEELSGVVAQRRRVSKKGNARAVGSLGDRLRPFRGATRFQRDGHRTLIVSHRRAVRPIETPRAAPPIFTQFRTASPQGRRGLIVERDAPSGVRRIDGDRQILNDLKEVYVCGGRTIGSVLRRAPGFLHMQRGNQWQPGAYCSSTDSLDADHRRKFACPSLPRART